MFAEAWEKKQQKPEAYTPFPPFEERAEWLKPAAFLRQRLIRRGAETLPQPIPELTQELWEDYFVTGRRIAFENVYFAKRKKLNRLVLAYCVSGELRFLARTEDYVRSLLAEPTWCLPCHHRYGDEPDIHQEVDPERPVIDLFAAETGSQLAVLYYLLKNELRPELARELTAALDQRVLDAYLNNYYWWMGKEGQKLNNWTPWCTENVLETAYFRGRDLTPFIPQACRSLDGFVNSYGEDGCCDEGVQYYRRAALAMWTALELLAQVYPQIFAALFKEAKIKHMAHYLIRMYVAGPWYFNFGDCSAKPGPCGIEEYLFGLRTGDEELSGKAGLDLRERELFPAETLDIGGIGLWNETMTLFHYEEAVARAREPKSKEDFFYPSTGVWLCRRGVWDLAVKAGDNGDSHNHNDTGSFILFADGEPVFIDVGVETYSQKTFSPQRYEIWSMRSSYHNLPTFGTIEQLPGEEYRASDIKIDFPSISMELAGAYPPIESLSTYRRDIRLSPKGFELQERTDYEDEVTLSLMSVLPPAEVPGGLSFGSRYLLEGNYQSAVSETIPVEDPRLRWSWPEKLYRTRLKFRQELRLKMYKI